MSHLFDTTEVKTGGRFFQILWLSPFYKHIDFRLFHNFWFQKEDDSDKNSPAKGTPTKQEPEPDKASSFSKELARLQFFGAGPKLAGVPTEKQTRDKTRGVKLNFEYDPVSYLFADWIPVLVN